MKDPTSNLLFGLAAGGGAMWAFSRWKRGQDQRRREDDRLEDWGAEHDEDPIAPTLDASAPSDPASATPTLSSPTKPSSKRGLTREFDPVFLAHGMGLPVPYLRALAARESGMNPNDDKGLINVVRVVLDDFNDVHRADLLAADLKEPRTNVTIASWALRKIIDSYAKWHADVPNLREDWSNPNFVELLTFSWNAGWSRTKGVGRVVEYLKQRGQRDITLTDVVKHAHAAGAKHWLWAHPKKPKWTASVAKLYFEELDRDIAAGRMAPPEPLPSVIDPYPEPTAPTIVYVDPPPVMPPPATSPPDVPPTAPDAAPTLPFASVWPFTFGRPVPDDVKAIVSSGWPSPRKYRHGMHHAIDLPLEVGTLILAVDDGVVSHVGRKANSDAGLYVSINHPSGVTSRYLHLSEPLVIKDQPVRRGEVIGLSGDTGHSSAPHLHLDLHVAESMLPPIVATVGAPTTGFGKARKGLGVAIPAEPWIPVDGYQRDVIRQSADTGIPLYRTLHPQPATPDPAPPAQPMPAPDPAGDVSWV